MGAFVAKPKGGDGSGSSYAPTVSGLGGPDGFLRDTCIEGILNLENRQVNNDTFAKISAVQQVTRQVLSLSLANNRITALVFDEAGGNVLAAALVPAARQSSGGAADVSTNASPAAPTASVDDDDDLEREQSVLRSRVGKSPPPPAPPLRSSANWPMLENLDLSGNNELFNYSGLASVTATLRSLRLANNGIFKVPTDVWALSNLTKLDLSHNRLLVLPVGISMLTKLNSLKLSHNSLVSNGTTSCLPEEMRLCSRLRRLDLSHNKLRELPVNWRVDREHQRRSTLRQGQSSNAGTAASSPRIKAGDASRSPVLQSKRATGSPSFSLAGGGAFKKADPNDPPPSLTLGGSSFTAVSAAIAAAAAAASAPPVPIKYFDPNRVSYIQITLLNLSNNQIDSLSPSIGLLRSLNSLNLGYNKLRSLPTEIALLTELKYLDLRFNSLPSLLTEICQLPRLSKLCLQNNKISGLPYEIRKLKKLTHFFISSNQLVDLPDVISEIRNVRVLKLCNNKLLTIPDSMFRLQKLRLLDLSFNKLTYLSPDVCTMPLIEDLRLWGNKLADIPPPILYSDVKKIIHYLRATERERCIIANQMRSLQGPRSYSRLSSIKRSPTHSRAQSATRAMSQPDRRFAPLGFYDDREGDRADGAPLMPGSSRSVGSAPGLGGGGGRRRVGGGGGGTAAALLNGSDSCSEPEEFGSDDEFTSMFRAVTSRTGSFTNFAPGLANASDAATRASSASTRRSVAGRSPNLGLAASPRDQPHTTIVQPFQQHTLGLGGVGVGSGGGGTGGGSSGSVGDVVSGRRNSTGPSGGVLHAIRDHADDRDEEEDGDLDADADVDIDTDDGPRADVLTDLVRREWQPGSSPRDGLPPAHPGIAQSMTALAADTAADSSSTRGGSNTNTHADKALLMAEWDLQSMAIEQQRKGPSRRTGSGLHFET